MKKTFFILSLTLLFSIATFAQDFVISDFESGTIFDISGTEMSGKIVDNPNNTGINTSSKVLRVKATTDWSENLSAIAQTSFNFYTHPILSFKVYVTDTIELVARFDNDERWQQMFYTSEFPLNGGQGWKITGTSLGKWIELTYDLSQWDNISGYNQLKITTINHSKIDSFYIDDVKFTERNPVFNPESTIVPLFYEPVTTIKWVGGDWIGPVAANKFEYEIQKDEYNMLETDTIMLSSSGYLACPNDTIKGSSGGAAYILSGRYRSITFPGIPTRGAGHVSLNFDMAVIGKTFSTGIKPKFEVKFDAGAWSIIDYFGTPTADSTWNRISIPLSTASVKTSVRLTNETSISDSTNFWIDDVTLLGTTVNWADSIVVEGYNAVNIDHTLQLSAKSYPLIASDVFNWSVSNINIASIDQNGLLTGKTLGKVWVIVKTEDGSFKKDSMQITIQAEDVKVSEITLMATKNALKLGSDTITSQMSAIIYPSSAIDKSVTWSVNANATITSDGLLIATNVGEAIVTATANDGSGVTGTKTIFILAVPVTQINISTTKDTITATGTTRFATLTANIYPDHATNKTVTWSVDANATITHNGQLTATHEGKSVVTVTANDGSLVTASKTITIVTEKIKITGLTINSTKDTITVTGDNRYATLTANIFPAEATLKTVTWSVDANATITTSGVLTASSIGTAIVTAKANDGSGVVGTKLVTVIATPVIITPTAVHSIENAVVNVYPNPASDMLFIDSNELVTKAEVLNLFGTIETSLSSNGITFLPIGKLTVGSYILRLTSINGNVRIVKFVKEK